MYDVETGFKAITKVKLLELMSQLPDDTLFSCQSRGQTGNLSVYKGTWPDEERYGYIDFRTEEIEQY